MATAARESRNDAASAAKAKVSLPPTHPGSWAQLPFKHTLQLSRSELEEVQLAALRHRFDQLKDRVEALHRLAKKQGVSQINTLSDVLPVLFDHRVHKSYPASLIETRDFGKLTAWLGRLTLHDLSRLDLDGLTSLDSWLDRLDDYGMLVGTSTGTTGKLSFVPRSRAELPAWKGSFDEAMHASSGVDPRTDFLPTFFPSYRGGHQMAQKMFWLLNVPAAGGLKNWHTLYQTRISTDLLSLAGRLQSAEDRGEIERLALDPALLEQRKEMIEQGKRRDQDVEDWFLKMIQDFRGQRVKITGSQGDLSRVAVSGNANGRKCDFAPGSVICTGGGMKGYKDTPADYEQQIKNFFGIDRITSTFGMSECAGTAAKCDHGFYHFFPYTIPYLLDAEGKELPRQGVQTGRLALFDLLAETHWGGCISGDRVTMHWDEDCACGWKGPRITKEIVRFAEMEGGDDKITCAGSVQAYNEFMEFVANV